ncbi:MAG: nuclear transport factor 2 family protein [Gammaproteobacteria bacterium]
MIHGALKIAFACLWLLGIALLRVEAVFAAGAVEMQVEHIVDTAINEYNQGMESGNPDGWLKYFTDNIQRQSPLSAQTGQAEFADYYRNEFSSFKAHWTSKKMIVNGRSVAVLFDWEAVHKASGTPVKIEMAAFFDMATSGRFESVSFVFDSAKLAQLTGAK